MQHNWYTTQVQQQNICIKYMYNILLLANYASHVALAVSVKVATIRYEFTSVQCVHTELLNWLISNTFILYVVADTKHAVIRTQRELKCYTTDN